MQRLFALTLAFLILTACNQPTPTTNENPTTENPQPQPEHKVTFDKTVTWAAYQKDGKWQVVELSKNADTVVTLTGKQGAFVYLCDQLADEFNPRVSQSIFYFESDTLQKELEENSLEQLPAFFCMYTGEIPTPPTLPTAKIQGKILGAGETNSHQFVFSNSNGSVPGYVDFLEPNTYKTYNTPAGLYDALAAITPKGAFAPSHAVIDRNAVTVADGDVSYDFDLSKAVKLDSYTFSWAGLKDVTSVWTSVYKSGLSMFSANGTNNATTISYSALPLDYAPEATYSVYSQVTADGCSHSFWADFKRPSALEVSAVPCATLDFVLDNSNTHPRLSLSWTYPTPYQPKMFGLSFEQDRLSANASGNSSYDAGISFFGNFKGMASYTLEDFSTLPGWNPEWSLKNEATAYNIFYADRTTLPTGVMQDNVAARGAYQP